MSAEPNTSPSAHPLPSGQAGEDTNQSRPWTPAAAMEPVPPSAPPPARPGAGTPVLTGDRSPATGNRVGAVVGLAAVALIVVVLVILLLAGRL